MEMRLKTICLAFSFALFCLVNLVQAQPEPLKLIVTMTGENDGDWFGWVLDTAGDVDDDGYSDVIIGAPLYSGYKGKAYIYYGADSMDNAVDWFLAGEVTNQEVGTAVSGVGYFNGDSFPDVAVGDPGYGSNLGRVLVFFGGSLGSEPNLVLPGQIAGCYFGCQISNAGDVNKDGLSDILITTGGSPPYWVYLFYGGDPPDTTTEWIVRPSGCSRIAGAGDVNGDGWDDILVGASYNERKAVLLYLGGSPMDTMPDVVFYGRYLSICGAGDLNGDGYGDIAIGRDPTRIYFGGAAMDTIVDLILSASELDDGFGVAVACAGDVNKDGYSDLVVGAPHSHYDDGKVYVYLGGSPMDTLPDAIMAGSGIGQFGAAVASAGDVNGDGCEDILVGEYGWWIDKFKGRAHVFAGDSLMYNSGVEEGDSYKLQVISYELGQNYPNPFNATTIINYELRIMNSPNRTTLKIYNLLGQEVKTLVDKLQKGGRYEVTWDGRSDSGEKVGSGIYFYRLEVIGDRLKVVRTRKMLLIR